MRKVKEIYEEIAKLYNEAASIEAQKKTGNTGMLVEEVYNLLHGVGQGFVPGDYYASTRYYSQIPGVKNLRLDSDNTILVKISSPVGKLLPSEIDVEGRQYRICLMESSKFNEGIDY